MIKLLIFIRKLPHLTREQFIDYYESRHAPLASRIFPMCRTYIRNFMQAEIFGQDRENAYDVVTEMSFATKEDYQRWHEIAADPAVLAEIRADEANFLISDATRIFLVEEHASSCG